MLSVPLHGQFEQLMNARYLEREGYGVTQSWMPAVDVYEDGNGEVVLTYHGIITSNGQPTSHIAWSPNTA